MAIERQFLRVETVNGTVFALYCDTDTVEGTSTPRRESFFPGADISSQSDEIKAACAAAWTADVLAAWHAKMAALPPVPA